MDSPSSPSLPDRQTKELADLLQKHFTQRQRLAILREMQIDPEDVQLLPETREDFSWRMVEYCQRCGRLDELWRKVEERIPHNPSLQQISTARHVLLVAFGRYRKGCVVLVAVVLSLGGVAALLWPGSSIPQLPPGGGVVLVRSWLASSEISRAGADLCDALGQADTNRTRCTYRPLLGRSDADVVAAARNAGASIVLIAGDDGRARLVPLGQLEGQDIFSADIPPLDLLRPADTPRRLASLAHALSRIAAADQNFNPGLVRCPEVFPLSDDPTALLGLLVGLLAPRCAPAVPDPSVVDSICGDDGSEREASWGCAVARLFYINQCSDCIQAEKMASRLREQGPERFRVPAAIWVGRRACAKGDMPQARKVLDELLEYDNSCVRIKAAEITECLRYGAWQNNPQAPPDPSLAGLDERFEKDLKQCDQRILRARALGMRAWWRSRMHRWEEAAQDYRRAVEAYKDLFYVLNRAAAELHMKDYEHALETLESIHDLEDTLDTENQAYYVVLRWVALRQIRPSLVQIAADQLMQSYGKIELGKRVFASSADSDMRSLVCGPGRELCVYDVLASDKTEGSAMALERLLAGAAKPPSP